MDTPVIRKAIKKKNRVASFDYEVFFLDFALEPHRV